MRTQDSGAGRPWPAPAPAPRGSAQSPDPTLCCPRQPFWPLSQALGLLMVHPPWLTASGSIQKGGTTPTCSWIPQTQQHPGARDRGNGTHGGPCSRLGVQLYLKAFNLKRERPEKCSRWKKNDEGWRELREEAGCRRPSVGGKKPCAWRRGSPGLEARCGGVRKGLCEAGQRPHPQTSIMALTRAATQSPLNLWRRGGQGAAGPPSFQPSWRRSISTPLPLRKPAWARLEQSQINNTS